MDVHSAESAPADAAPFMCTACHSRVFLRRTAHQRPHWAHFPTGTECAMRRDAVTTTEYRARFAQEINTYAP
jgi:competence CoiA-like predicted nuclease